MWERRRASLVLLVSGGPEKVVAPKEEVIAQKDEAVAHREEGNADGPPPHQDKMSLASSAGDRYAVDEEETPDNPTCSDNCGNCGCETCTPDKGNIIYGILIVVLGVIAVVAGTFIGRETIQSIEDFNFPVKDASNVGVAMANLLLYKEYAALYIPGGNSSYLGTGTQTFFDFEKNMTSTIDTDNDLCFIKAMDKADVDSFKTLKEALLKGKSIAALPTTVSTGKMKFTDAIYTQVREMGKYAKEACERMTRIYSIAPGTITPLSGANCTVTNLPSYTVGKVSGNNLLQIKEFNEIISSCK